MSRQLLSRLLLSLGAVIALLVAIELALRVAGLPRQLDPHTETPRFAVTGADGSDGAVYVNYPGRLTFRYDGNPRGYFNDLGEVHHQVNPAGFRGRPFGPKPAAVRRIVFLGDSFTFGEGVRDEDTYPEVTARQLLTAGIAAESINLGVGGFNTTQEADLLHAVGLGLKPDIVVVGYTLNDAEPPLFQIDPVSKQPVRRDREALIEAEGQPRHPPATGLYRLRLAKLVWKAQRTRRLSEQTVAYYHEQHAPGSSGRVESERALRSIIGTCRDNGIPCVVILFPVLYELSDDYPFGEIHDSICRIATQAGGTCIDLLPALKGQDARSLWVHPTDQHPNEKVHALAGRLLAEHLAR